MESVNNMMWLGGCSVEDLLREFGSPLYVYEADSIYSQYRKLRKSFAEVPVQIHYAMKANYNPAILKILLEEGAWIDAVAPMEAQLALEVGFPSERILFTGNNVGLNELEYCLEHNIPINIESLTLLEKYGEKYPGTEVSVRINPGVGSGHHAHCITGGPQSKFGVYHDRLKTIQEIVRKYDLSLIGIHSHIGTGILEPEPMIEAVEMVLSIARQLHNLQFIDFGGGFGVPYHPDQKPLDVETLGQKMTARFQKFCKEYGSDVKLKIEPGRYLIANAGTLLATVTNMKQTPQYQFVGMDTGFNHLLRPAMYGSYHRIYNASRMEGKMDSVILAGNICETGDVFNHTSNGLEPRWLPRLQLGDCVAIADTGAYGMCMSSHYNMRPRPAEVMVEQGQARLIRRRDTYQDITQGFVT